MNQLACLQDRCWKSNNWSGTKTRAREEDNIIKTRQHATSLNLRRETVWSVWWGGCGEIGKGSSSGVSETIFPPVFVRVLLIFAHLLWYDDKFHASTRCRFHLVEYFTILHCVLYPSVKCTHSNPNYVLVIRSSFYLLGDACLHPRWMTEQTS